MRLIISFLVLFLFAQPANAQSWFDRIFSSSKESSQKEQVALAKAGSFSEEERKRIRDYFLDKILKTGKSNQDSEEQGSGKKGRKKAKKNKGKSNKMPPGLAKKESLPPGLAKQLKKNGTLPPGLEKRSLPAGLEGKLITRKEHNRVIVDRDVVLIEKATGKILDILKDVVVGQ